MSMVVAEISERWSVALTVSASLAAIVVALFAGAPRRIRGPKRLGERETVSDVLSVTGMGLMAWAAAIYFIRRSIPGEPNDADLLVLDGGSELCAFLAMLAATATIRQTRFTGVGLNFSRLGRGISLGILATVVVLPLVLLVNVGTECAWNHFHKDHPAAHDMLLMFTRNNLHVWVRIGIVLSAVATAPLAEEFFFRGGVQTVVTFATGQPWVGVIVTSMLFALVHPWWSWPPIFFLGLCLGYLYERTGNLWGCIVLHSLFNCSAFLMYVKP